jgi:hypothetical protein
MIMIDRVTIVTCFIREVLRIATFSSHRIATTGDLAICSTIIRRNSVAIITSFTGLYLAVATGRWTFSNNDLITTSHRCQDQDEKTAT